MMRIKLPLFYFSVLQVLGEKCITPNNEEAECISVHSCSILKDALATLDNSSIEFVLQSRCGNLSDRKVCCGSTSNLLPSGVSNGAADVIFERSQMENISSLSNRRYCGYQHTDDYIHTKNQTYLDEFPWTAALQYKVKNTTWVGCSGSLINARYVLTAAQCIIDISLVAVRLGEYHTEQDDCVKYEYFKECSDPVQDFGIEELTPYPGYNYSRGENDIGLIRLNETVTYSDYIRPICLPIPGTVTAKVGDILIFSSWGIPYDEEVIVTDIKKKVSTSLIPNEECERVYNNTGLPVTDDILCMQERERNPNVTCLGNNGAPLMFSHRFQWHQEGIVVRNLECGVTPYLSVRVSKYLQWIHGNLKPWN